MKWVLSSCFMGLALLLSAGCSERTDTFYPDKAAALADGAFTRGWLPGLLPASASDIVESHDLDTNSVVGSFRLSAEGMNKLWEQMESFSNQGACFPDHRLLQRNPRLDKEFEALSAPRTRFYVWTDPATETSWCVAIPHSQDVVLFWKR